MNVFFAIETANKSSNVIDGMREGGGGATVLRGKFSKFLKKKKISIELILNAALSAACLLPHSKVRAEGEQGAGPRQGDYNSIKLPSGPPRTD